MFPFLANVTMQSLNCRSPWRYFRNKSDFMWHSWRCDICTLWRRSWHIWLLNLHLQWILSCLHHCMPFFLDSNWKCLEKSREVVWVSNLDTLDLGSNDVLDYIHSCWIFLWSCRHWQMEDNPLHALGGVWSLCGRNCHLLLLLDRISEPCSTNAIQLLHCRILLLCNNPIGIED